MRFHAQVAKFGHASGVIGKGFHAFDTGVFAPLFDCGEVLRSLVYAGDDGTAEEDGSLLVEQELKVAPDQWSVRLGPLVQSLGVAQFPVEMEEIHKRQEFAKSFRFHLAAGVQAGMDSFGSSGLQQCLAEVELEGGFASGKGDSAAGVCIVGAIGPDHFHNCVYGHFRSINLAGKSDLG